jgi:hypothetical protein
MLGSFLQLRQLDTLLITSTAVTKHTRTWQGTQGQPWLWSPLLQPCAPTSLMATQSAYQTAGMLQQHNVLSNL